MGLRAAVADALWLVYFLLFIACAWVSGDVECRLLAYCRVCTVCFGGGNGFSLGVIEKRELEGSEELGRKNWSELVGCCHL